MQRNNIAVSAVLVIATIGFVAQWSILSNAMYAVFLGFYAPFRVGDEIEIIEPSVDDPGKGGVGGRSIRGHAESDNDRQRFARGR
jgi:hypothetical protein